MAKQSSGSNSISNSISKGKDKDKDTTPPSPSSSATTSSPTLSEFPSLGDSFATREELSSIIKNNGKALGYIFKCSVTSEHRVTYYCSNKYHAPRCMAGFKAAWISKAQGWVVTEATEHNEGCTRLRQRVNGQNGIKTEGNTVGFVSKKGNPSIVLKYTSKTKPANVKLAATTTSTAITTSHTASSSNYSKTRKNISTFSDTIQPGTSDSISSRINQLVNNSNNNIGNKDNTRDNNDGGRIRSYSTSTGTSTSISSPPSSIVNARRSSLNGCRWGLKEVNENEALQDDQEEEEEEEDGDDDGGDCDVTMTYNNSRNKLTTSQHPHKSKKKSKTGNNKANAEGGRNRSSSSGSASSSSSSSSSNPTSTTTTTIITTILDPEFHFPPASLKASIDLQKQLPLRKRKRSSSYIKKF